MLPPGLDDRAGLTKISEPVLIQAAVPEPGVEAFQKSVLNRLAWLNELQLHVRLLAEKEHGLARHLRAIVENDAFRQPALFLQRQ